MLDTHLHERYFLSNKCSYYIYYNQFHTLVQHFKHLFQNKTAPVKSLTGAVQIFYFVKK